MDDIESLSNASELASRGRRWRKEDIDYSATATERRRTLKALLKQFQEVAADERGDNEQDGDQKFMTQDLLEQIESFIVEVAKCYQSYGCPTNTNEVNLRRTAQGLGVKARILVLPTQIFIQTHATEAAPETGRRYSHFFRSSSGFNFYKLRLVDDLVRKISSYAQNSQLAAETPQEQESLIEEAIQQAKEHVEFLSTRIPVNPTVSADQEESLPEWIVSESNEDAFIDTGESIPQDSASPSAAMEDHEPLTEEILDTLMCRLSKASPINQPRIHDYAAESKLAKLILIMASVGPDVYSAQGFDSDEEEGELNLHRHHNYRNLFLKLALEDGVRLIHAIKKQEPLYSIWFKILWTGISSFGSCGLFYRGSWMECALSGVLGAMVACIEQFSTISPTFTRIFEFAATFTASMIIRAISAHYKHICYDVVVVSSIVYYLQGAGITIGFVDVMTKDIICGTTQVMLGILISAMIGFAMDLSTSTYAEIVDRSYSDVTQDSVCGNAVGPNWYPFMFVLVIVGFGIFLESHIVQFPAMIFVAGCCYVVYYYLELLTNNEIATVVAAFTASFLANLYSRRSGRAAVVYTIPAIFLLVPDSMENSAFYSVLLDRKGSPALTFAVVSSALSIAVGIFAGSVLAPVPDVDEIFRTAYAAFPGAHRSHSGSPTSRKHIYVNSGLKY